ncbi:hypothetical protein Tco_0817135 [Tanacetum coccineum]
MSSGSQSAGDAVISKFDMHVNPSVLSFDKVNSLVAEYAIPSDLHPCVPPSGLTMNRLPTDKIDRRVIPDAMSWRHQDSRLANPSPIGVHAEDIRRLCENVIDLRPVHPAMLYAVGLTTIWKHVGHHPVFKDGKGNVATSMSQFLKFPMAGGVRIPEKSDHQRVFEVKNERVLVAKRKSQIAKDKAVRKKAAEGVSHRTKKRKTTPLSVALLDSKADESNRSGSGTHHSAYPLNTIISNEDGLATSLISEPVNQTEEGMDQPLDNVEDTIKVNSPQFEHSPQYQQSDHSGEDTQTVRSSPERTHASGSAGHGVGSTSGGSHRLAFPARHPGGDGAGSSLQRDAGAPELFVLAWNLTTHLILNDTESCRDMMRYEALNEDYRELFESHRSCRAVSDMLTEIQNKLLDTVRSRNQLSEDHKALQQIGIEREREERIQRLEADLASKTSSLTEAEGVVGTLRGDLERLTVDLSQAEIVRHNYIRQKLPTVVQRLLSSDEYKKSLTDVFNLDIAAGWSEGVKAACSEEEAQDFLATAIDYDPACKETFMTEFDSLFDKSYPYVEKLAESFRLPLGDLQNMWPEGIGPTLSGNAAGASTTADASNNTDASDVAEAQKSCAPGNRCHLAIGSWTHPECLAFRVMASLGQWLLNSSGTSCAPSKGRHMAIGSWTHPECETFIGIKVVYTLVT